MYFLELVISGIAVGSLYALIAMGFVLIYKGTGVINFAQGEAIMVAAFIAYYLVGFGVPFWLAVPLTLVASALLGRDHRTSGHPAFVGGTGLFRGHGDHWAEHFSAFHGRHRLRTPQLCFSPVLFPWNPSTCGALC